MLLAFLRRRSTTARIGAHVRRNRNHFHPSLEQLEDRVVPYAISSSALPGVQLLGSLAPGAYLANPLGGPAPGGGLSPAQVAHAYGFDQITFGSVKGDGTGQTIAIIDAYDDPNITSDLATFDSTLGLSAPPSFVKVNQTGGTSYPAADQNWGLEISLDVEWAHAMAPGANILLVEANSNSLSELMTAVDYARNQPGTAVVSMSWGGSEWAWESSYDSYFTTPAGHSGVTFVASSGDGGSASAPEYPSVSPNVIAVGGTQLSTDSLGNYLSETGWSGSGGGISAYHSQPAYQQGVVTQSSSLRTVPDVAYDGSGASPFAVYDTCSYSGWLQVYGTSAGAPQWAALVAIADQGLALAGQGALDGPGQTLPMLYQLPASDFHDITSGSNGAFTAGPGYDLVTGLGSPVANQVVAGLVGSTSVQPTNQPPVITTPASASSNPVTGSATNLSVQASDDGGAANLTYTWSVPSVPAGATAPTFSVNSTNSAQNTTATFSQAGVYTIQVTVTDSGGLTATSSVAVTVGDPPANQPPVITTPASASSSPVTGTTTTLSVQASDDGGASNLTYTWSAVGAPAGAPAPAFNINSTSNAQSTTVTFQQAGTYTFQVTVTDSGGLTATSSVTVIVNQKLTSVAVTPAKVSVRDGTTQQFTATTEDQFGLAMSTQPAWTWAMAGGAGKVSSGGLYTAPGTGTGTASVRASGGGLNATASINFGTLPAAPSNLTAQVLSSGPVSLAWKDHSNNETGFLIKRSTDGINWVQVATVGAGIQKYTDSSVAAGQTYYYCVCAYNSFGASANTNVVKVTTPGGGGGPAVGIATSLEGPGQGKAGRQSAVDGLMKDATFLDSLASSVLIDLGGEHGRPVTVSV